MFKGSQLCLPPDADFRWWLAGGACFDWPRIREAALGPAPPHEAPAFKAYFWRTHWWYRGHSRHFGVDSPVRAAFFDLFGVTADGKAVQPTRRRTVHAAVCGVDIGIDPESDWWKAGQGNGWFEKNSRKLNEHKYIVAEKVDKEVKAGRFELHDQKPEGACVSRSSLTSKDPLSPDFSEKLAKFWRLIHDFTYEGSKPGLHAYCSKDRFPDYIPYVKLEMFERLVWAMEAEFPGEELQMFILDLKAAYRSFDTMDAQRRFTVLRLWTFASEADANSTGPRQLVLRYVRDLACPFGGRWSGYADYEFVIAAIWGYTHIFAPALGLRVGLVVATDDFIGLTRRRDAELARDLLRVVLQLAGWGVEGKSHPDIIGPLDTPRCIAVWIGCGFDLTNLAEKRRFLPPAYLAKHRPAMEGWAAGTVAAVLNTAEQIQGRGLWMAQNCPSMAPFLGSIIGAVTWLRRRENGQATAAEVALAVARSRKDMAVMLGLIDRMQATGRQLMCEPTREHTWELGIFTDSTKGSDDGVTRPGFGVMIMGVYVTMEWPARMIERATNPTSGLVDNTILEMAARCIGILIAREIWPEGLERKHVKVFTACDNTAVVAQAGKKRARNAVANDMLLGVACVATIHGFEVDEAAEPGGTWVGTKEMYWGDPASRCLGGSRDATHALAELWEQIDGRPVVELVLNPNDAIFDWSDPVAIMDWSLGGVVLPPHHLAAWQPSSDPTLGRAQQYLVGVDSVYRRSRRVQGISCDGYSPLVSDAAEPFQDSCRPSISAPTSDTPLCSPGHATSSGAGTLSRPSTTTLGTSLSPIGTSSTTTLLGTSASGADGGADSGSQGNGRQGGCGLRPEASCWRPPGGGAGAGQAGGAEEQASRSGPLIGGSLGPWSWAGLVPCGERSTPPVPEEKLETYNFAGDVFVSRPPAGSGAGGTIGDAHTSCARSTGRATPGISGSGSLSTLLATPPFVRSSAYGAWQLTRAAQETSQCVSGRTGVTSPGTM